MERYAPTLKDLAPRDIVSRCMFQEIKEGRGIDGKDYVHLDLRHLGRKVLDEKIPDITDFMRVYQGLEAGVRPDPDASDRPLRDGRHSHLNYDAEVIVDDKNTRMLGFFAARRVRLRQHPRRANPAGRNSLVDIVVFGRRGGEVAGFAGRTTCRRCRRTRMRLP